MTEPGSAPLRILSIAHTAVSRNAGRLRYRPLGKDPTLEIRLIIPQRWHQFGRWSEADPGDEPGIAVKPLPIRLPRAGPAGWYLHFYPGLGRQVRQFAPNVIHLWEEPWSVVALHASLLARRIGAALVLEIDQNILKRLPPPFEAIRRYTLRCTNLVLARSPMATDVARACGYVGPSMQIGYGVDKTLFHAGPSRPAMPPLHIGYVGRLIDAKGVDDILSAMSKTSADVRLTVLGEGPHEPALRAHVAESGLGDRVTFHPWGGPDDVAKLLRELHALILPTRTTNEIKEQFGRVIIESQACGTPVIGSTCGAIPDVVGAGGWIVSERDPDAIAALLDRLSTCPEEIAARSVEGLANVAERFTYDEIAQDLALAFRIAHSLRTRSTALPFPSARERAMARPGQS